MFAKFKNRQTKPILYLIMKNGDTGDEETEMDIETPISNTEENSLIFEMFDVRFKALPPPTEMAEDLPKTALLPFNELRDYYRFKL